MVICALLCGNVYAADVPIKKISVFQDVLLLTEDGNLLLADTVNATTKKLLYRNVIDFQLEHVVTDRYIVYTSDGKILYLDLGFGTNTVKRFPADIKTPIYLSNSYKSIYIDSENRLIKHNISDDEKTIMIENVIKATKNYAITFDHSLYSYNTDTNEWACYINTCRLFRKNYKLKI